MERLSMLWLTLGVTLLLILTLGWAADRIPALARIYAPRLRDGRELFLLWALSVWAAFTLGLNVMLIILHS